MDVSETDQDVRVRVDIPGIDPKDVTIEGSEDSLYISGKLDKTDEEKGENLYRMERHYGSFSREFALPSRVDPDKIEASAKNGVISIVLQKQEDEQKKRVSVKISD